MRLTWTRQFSVARMMLAVALFAVLTGGAVGTARRFHRWAAYQQEAGECSLTERLLLREAEKDEALAKIWRDSPGSEEVADWESLARDCRRQALVAGQKRRELERRWW
jgi:hypothetical protein